MSRKLLGTLAIVSCTVWVASCSTTVSHGDGESHFLGLCASSCPGGLECVCGACTKPCTGNAQCDGFGARAICASAAACGESGKACEIACSVNADCSGYGASVCQGGVCIAPEIGDASMGSSRDASVDHSSPRPDVGPTHGADATLPGADVTSSPDPSKKYPGYVWCGSPSLAPAECDLAKGEVCCTHTLFGGVPIRPSLCTPADASCTISVGCDEDADCPVGQRCISFIPGGFNSGSACEAPTDGAPHLPPPTDAAPPDAGNDFCSALAACTRFERDFPGQEGYSGGERVCGRDEHTCHVTVALIGGTVDRYSCELPPGFACDAAGNTPLDLTNPTICTRLPPCGGPDGGPACPSDLLSCDAAP